MMYDEKNKNCVFMFVFCYVNLHAYLYVCECVLAQLREQTFVFLTPPQLRPP